MFAITRRGDLIRLYFTHVQLSVLPFPLHRTAATPAVAKGISIDLPEQPAGSKIKVAMISAVAIKLPTKRRNVQLMALSLYEINEAIEGMTTMDQWKTQIPTDYHEFLDLSEEKLAREIPPHRFYYHIIPLMEAKEPPFGPLYGMSRDELFALKECIEENLCKGFIKAISSPAGAPVLFIKKRDGSLRFSVGYCGITEMTIKNRYPLPLIQETLMRLSKVKWVTKLDLQGAYNLVRMA